MIDLRVKNPRHTRADGRPAGWRKAAAAAALILSVSLLSACGGRNDETITVAGSTSVQPYAEMLAEEYEIRYPGNVIDIQGGGSSAGIAAVESDAADIGMSSRALDEKEQELWFVEIAKDGLAVIINHNNPIQDLTLDQIRGIYTTAIPNWSELGGPEAKIHVIAREEGSGTRSAFESLVMGGEPIAPRAIIQASNGAVRQLVSGDPHSIGFISLGLVDQTVKALRLEGVAATWDNVMNGSYRLFRPFLFIAGEQPTGLTEQFIHFTLSLEGQQLLVHEGLIPVTEGVKR